MTNEEAARILDPATSAEALRPYALDCVMRMAVVEEACRMGAETLRTENALRLEAVKDISTDRLRELAEADKDGRLVVPPCKVGDKVRVDARTWGNTWNYKTVDGGKYLLGEIVSIIKTRKQTLIKIRVEHNVSWKRPMCRYPISAIGKTVFLTREEAEAVLAQEGGKDHA